MIHLLNTTIIPATAPATFVARGRTVTVEEARELVGDGFVSHIGHESTAQIFSEILGVPVPMDRRPWDASGVGLILQLNGRPPEGRILTREEIESIGYTLRVMVILTD